MSHCRLLATVKQPHQPLQSDTNGDGKHVPPELGQAGLGPKAPPAPTGLPGRHLNWAFPDSGGAELTGKLRPGEDQWHG